MNSKLYHDRNWLFIKYKKEHWSMNRIAEHCNCTTSKILYWLKKFDIKIRTHKELGQLIMGDNNPARKPGIGDKISRAKKNVKFTEAHKKALSDSWQVTYEYRISAIKQGWKDHPEAREKLRQSRLGKKASLKSCQKSSESHKGLQAGPNHPNYRGGNSSSYKLHLTDRNWHELRKQVYQRDNWTCQDCGKKCHRGIACHHIIPYRISQDDSMDNLITLCTSCHIKREWKIQREFYLNNLALTRSYIGGN